jgi:transcriptional regulator with XRE-family HTH domain
VTSGETESSGPTVRRIVLGGQLRRLREAAGVSREEAGYAIRGSESKISRIELGRVSFKERDIADLLTLYGITDDEDRAAFLHMVKRSNEPNWLLRYNDTVPKWFQGYVSLEEAVSRIQTYETLFVPGLVQTERYATAVIKQGIPDAPIETVQQRVRLRMQRQRLLQHPRSPRFWAVIDEAILHRPIGGTEVLIEQIEHLLEVTRMPTITFQIMPLERGRVVAEGPFTIMRFVEAELSDLVYLEHLTGALFLDKPDEVEMYTKVSHRLAIEAETPEESRKRMSRILRNLKKS